MGEEGTIFFEGGAYSNITTMRRKRKARATTPGWSTLGDVGKLDSDGYLYLTDRKAFMIISGGVNIYPQETENLLIAHPKVADVAVIGVPNEEFGEEVKAVVQPVDINQAGPALAEELIAIAARTVPAQMSAVGRFRSGIAAPSTGKLYKRLIKDRYWIGHSKRIAE